MIQIHSVKRSGFTLIELLVVITLMAIAFTVSIVGLNYNKTKLTNTSYQLTQDIQGLYAETIKTGKLHRIVFHIESATYDLEVFELPKPKPKETDREELEKWEAEQSAIAEERAKKDWTKQNRLDFGTFNKMKTREIASAIKLKRLIVTRTHDEFDGKTTAMLFFPSGEVDQALFVLEDGDGRLISLIAEPMSGRVRVQQGEVTEETWFKEYASQKK